MSRIDRPRDRKETSSSWSWEGQGWGATTNASKVCSGVMKISWDLIMVRVSKLYEYAKLFKTLKEVNFMACDFMSGKLLLKMFFINRNNYD